MKRSGNNSRKALAVELCSAGQPKGLSLRERNRGDGCPYMRSPGVIGSAVAGVGSGGGVDIRNAGFLLVHSHHHVFLDDFPVGLARHRIQGNLAQVAGGDEIIE